MPFFLIKRPTVGERMFTVYETFDKETKTLNNPIQVDLSLTLVPPCNPGDTFAILSMEEFDLGEEICFKFQHPVVFDYYDKNSQIKYVYVSVHKSDVEKESQ